MTDVVAAVVALLKADAGVSGLAEARVYGGELPRSEVQSMPRAAIVVAPAGGGLIGQAYQNYGDQRVDVDCYGATPKQAWDLYLAAYSALKALRAGVHAGVLLHWARPSSKGSLARDPETDWPLAVSSFQVLAGEAAA